MTTYLVAGGAVLWIIMIWLLVMEWRRPSFSRTTGLQDDPPRLTRRSVAWGVGVVGALILAYFAAGGYHVSKQLEVVCFAVYERSALIDAGRDTAALRICRDVAGAASEAK